MATCNSHICLLPGCFGHQSGGFATGTQVGVSHLRGGGGGGGAGWRDELQALEAIFADDMSTSVIDNDTLVCRIAVDGPAAEPEDREPIILRVTAPADYPETLPAIAIDWPANAVRFEELRASLTRELEYEAQQQQSQPMIFHLFRLHASRVRVT